MIDLIKKMIAKAKRRPELKVRIVWQLPPLKNTGPKNYPNKKKVYNPPLPRKKRKNLKFSIRSNSRVYSNRLF